MLQRYEPKMKLTFIGTRGNIEARTPQHFNHTALWVGYRRHRVAIDCGGDWLSQSGSWEVDAIVLTHGHPDHVNGLKQGAPCMVFATSETWEIIGGFPIDRRSTVRTHRPFRIGEITVEAFGVEHSLRAPAVGYRIQAGSATIFYCPDIVYIHRRREALQGISAYIGDGATISRSMVHRRDDKLFGHAPVSTQLSWCRSEGVARAIFTHCGTEIVTADRQTLAAQVAELSQKYQVRVDIAEDGMEMVLRHQAAVN
jgi:phosphoribosyl 1,2-cyclic phosphodiesterase